MIIAAKAALRIFSQRLPQMRMKFFTNVSML
jgi:hypothetical protein